MAKLAATKDLGVPVPASIPPDMNTLVVYPVLGITPPSYDQAVRAQIPLAGIEKRTVGGIELYVFPASKLPALAEGTYNFYFTFRDDSQDEESDFSTAVAVPLDRTPPPRPGQPVVL